MPMPNNLFLVRHGQSEANIMVEADKNGDPSLYNDENLKKVPDNSWRLTLKGVEQAKAVGSWLKENYKIDKFFVSPFTRTQETAANLNLNPKNGWKEHRILRERSWGELNVMTRKQINELYSKNWLLKSIDPMYWKPPAGESLAEISENRVASFLRSLSREYVPDQNVIAVTHGEFMWSSRILIEYLSDEDFIELDRNPEERILNCMILQYSSVREDGGNIYKENRFFRTRKIFPYFDVESQSWKVKAGEWREFARKTFNDEELHIRALLQPNRF